MAEVDHRVNFIFAAQQTVSNVTSRVINVLRETSAQAQKTQADVIAATKVNEGPAPYGAPSAGMKDLADDVAANTGKIKEPVQQLEAEVSKMAGMLKNIFERAIDWDVAGMGLRGIRDVFQQITDWVVNLPSLFEKATLSMETFFGSATAAQQTMTALDAMTTGPNAIPVRAVSLIPVAQQMAARGVAAQQIPQQTRDIATAATLSGQGEQGVQNLAQTFGGMQETGLFNIRTVRSLGNEGVNAIQIMAKETHTSVQEITQDLLKGSLSVDEFFQSFHAYESTVGIAKLREIGDVTTNAMITSGEAIRKFGMTALAPVADEVQKLADSFRDLVESSGVQDWAPKLASAFQSIIDVVNSIPPGIKEAAAAYVMLRLTLQPLLELSKDLGGELLSLGGKVLNVPRAIGGLVVPSLRPNLAPSGQQASDAAHKEAGAALTKSAGDLSRSAGALDQAAGRLSGRGGATGVNERGPGYTAPGESTSGRRPAPMQTTPPQEMQLPPGNSPPAPGTPPAPTPGAPHGPAPAPVAPGGAAAAPPVAPPQAAPGGTPPINPPTTPAPEGLSAREQYRIQSRNARLAQSGALAPAEQVGQDYEKNVRRQVEQQLKLAETPLMSNQEMQQQASQYQFNQALAREAQGGSSKLAQEDFDKAIAGYKAQNAQVRRARLQTPAPQVPGIHMRATDLAFNRGAVHAAPEDYNQAFGEYAQGARQQISNGDLNTLESYASRQTRREAQRAANAAQPYRPAAPSLAIDHAQMSQRNVGDLSRQTSFGGISDALQQQYTTIAQTQTEIQSIKDEAAKAAADAEEKARIIANPDLNKQYQAKVEGIKSQLQERSNLAAKKLREPTGYQPPRPEGASPLEPLPAVVPFDNLSVESHIAAEQQVMSPDEIEAEAKRQAMQEMQQKLAEERVNPPGRGPAAFVQGARQELAQSLAQRGIQPEIPAYTETGPGGPPPVPTPPEEPTGFGQLERVVQATKQKQVTDAVQAQADKVQKAVTDRLQASAPSPEEYAAPGSPGFIGPLQTPQSVEDRANVFIPRAPAPAPRPAPEPTPPNIGRNVWQRMGFFVPRAPAAGPVSETGSVPEAEAGSAPIPQPALGPSANARGGFFQRLFGRPAVQPSPAVNGNPQGSGSLSQAAAGDAAALAQETAATTAQRTANEANNAAKETLSKTTQNLTAATTQASTAAGQQTTVTTDLAAAANRANTATVDGATVVKTYGLNAEATAAQVKILTDALIQQAVAQERVNLATGGTKVPGAGGVGVPTGVAPGIAPAANVAGKEAVQGAETIAAEETLAAGATRGATALSGLGTVAAALGGPIGVASIAITGLLIAYQTNFLGFQDAVNKSAEQLGHDAGIWVEAFGRVGSAAGDFFSNLSDAISNLKVPSLSDSASNSTVGKEAASVSQSASSFYEGLPAPVKTVLGVEGKVAKLGMAEASDPFAIFHAATGAMDQAMNGPPNPEPVVDTARMAAVSKLHELGGVRSVEMAEAPADQDYSNLAQQARLNQQVFEQLGGTSEYAKATFENDKNIQSLTIHSDELNQSISAQQLAMQDVSAQMVEYSRNVEIAIPGLLDFDNAMFATSQQLNATNLETDKFVLNLEKGFANSSNPWVRKVFLQQETKVQSEERQDTFGQQIHDRQIIQEQLQDQVTQMQKIVNLQQMQQAVMKPIVDMQQQMVQDQSDYYNKTADLYRTLNAMPHGEGKGLADELDKANDKVKAYQTTLNGYQTEQANVSKQLAAASTPKEQLAANQAQQDLYSRENKTQLDLKQAERDRDAAILDVQKQVAGPLGVPEVGQSISSQVKTLTITPDTKAVSDAATVVGTDAGNKVVDSQKKVIDSRQKEIIDALFNLPDGTAESFGTKLANGVITGFKNTITGMVGGGSENNSTGGAASGTGNAAPTPTSSTAAAGSSLASMVVPFLEGLLKAFQGPQSSQAGNPYGGKTGGIGNYATGGSFLVGGSGGTDSQLVRFMASPGERVTVETPSQQKASDAAMGAARHAMGASFYVEPESLRFAGGGSWSSGGSQVQFWATPGERVSVGGQAEDRARSAGMSIGHYASGGSFVVAPSYPAPNLVKVGEGEGHYSHGGSFVVMPHTSNSIAHYAGGGSFTTGDSNMMSSQNINYGSSGGSNVSISFGDLHLSGEADENRLVDKINSALDQRLGTVNNAFKRGRYGTVRWRPGTGGS